MKIVQTLKGERMSEKRFQKTKIVDKWGGIYDSETDRVLDVNDVEHKLNEQQATIGQLQDLCGKSDSENAKLRIENKKLQEEIRLLKPTNIEQYEQIVQLQEEINNNKLADSLADEIKKNGVLNEELNQLRIENMRLKKKGG